ncbi:MAG: peptidylprolyl isomerase [Acidobacteriota bacterium]
MRRISSVLAFTLFASLLSGCAATRPTAPAMPVLEVPYLEERALLLYMADRRTWEPFSSQQALLGPPDLRRQLAFTAGAVADPRGRDTLAGLLVDDDVTVRRAAAAGLGRYPVGDVEAATILLRAMNDADLETAVLAVESLARLGVTLEDVVVALADLPEARFFPLLLPSLFRFGGEDALPWATRGLEVADPALRKMAVYALSRDPQPDAAPVLRSLLTDADPWVRGWAARALGAVGAAEDLDRLLPLLDDPTPGPRIQALRAGRRLVESGVAAPPDAWRPKLLELFVTPDVGVRVTAIEASAAWLLDESLGTDLDRIAREATTTHERSSAVLSLATGQDPRADDLIARLAEAPDPVARTQAARAAGLAWTLPVIETLATDAVPGVRATALDVWMGTQPPGDLSPDARQRLRNALEDDDAVVRATAFDVLAERPVLTMERLLRAFDAGALDRMPDARLAAIRALTARAEAEPLERGAIIERLEKVATAGSFLERREAIDGLGTLGRPEPSLGPLENRRTMQIYRDIARRTHEPRRMQLDTEYGVVTLQIDCPVAPMTCLSFLQLANQGFYDGLSFHRVVPDFVVQGGDPRGDGSGGPGYQLREELNLIRYERGTLGMARAGRDTAGSQFFIALSPQPHLDFDYTAFGWVVSGAEVLDRIVQGDRILRLRELGQAQ